MLAGGCVIYRSTGRGGAFARAQEPHATTREGKNGDVDEFVVARNPDENSALPFLVKVPLRGEGVVLKVREVWPRTAKVYRHPSTDWPDEPDVVDRVPVRSCVRRGASIDLVLDRSRENRSQFVFTRARGRDVIFWQSARTAKQARPNVGVPRRRASGLVLDILVDSRERYPWTFGGQQATTRARPLPAGDYAVAVDGDVVCPWSGRVSPTWRPPSPLANSATCSPGWTTCLDRRWSSRTGTPLCSNSRTSAVRCSPKRWLGPGGLPDGAGDLLRDPPSGPGMGLPVPRGRGRPSPRRHIGGGARRPTPTGGPVAPPPPTASEIRAWAAVNGFEISGRGRIPKSVVAAFEARERS